MSSNFHWMPAPTSLTESRPFAGVVDTTTKTIKRRYTDFWIPTWVKFGLGGGQSSKSFETTALLTSARTPGMPNDQK
jgi:hypothetical protein